MNPFKYFSIDQRSFKIGIVVFIRYTPTERTELTSFLNDTVLEADSIDKTGPVSMLNLFKEVLVNNSGEGLV